MKPLTLLLFLAAALNAHADASAVARNERLAKLCKVWGAVRYLHPWVWTRDVDWDAALLRALPRARSATSNDELAAAVDEMLGELHDPATRVTAQLDGAKPAPPLDAPFLSWPRPGTLLVRIAARHATPDVASATALLKDAKRVLLDLRLPTDRGSTYGAARDAQTLLRALVTHELRVPPSRSVVHRGYNVQNNVSLNSNQSFFEQEAVEIIPANPGAVRRPLAVIVNEVLGVPEEALALQAANEATILAQGATFDDLTVGAVLLPLDDTRVVRMRRAELIPVGAMPHADGELPANATEPQVMDAAVASLAVNAPRRQGDQSTRALPPLVWRPDKDYASERAPSLELRLLALFRLWNVVDRFYPYKGKGLLDETWDDLLTRYIARFEAADSATAYVETVAELAAHIADSHTQVRGGDSPWVSPPARARLLARMIEGQAVVVASDDEARASGLHVGDVIVAVDSEPIAARMQRLRRFVAASNDAAQGLKTLSSALGGADGTTMALTVRDASGRMRQAELVRHVGRARDLAWRTGDVVRVLDGNVGYVDLDRLQADEVDDMFAKLEHTRAIIFDMRGYPNGTAWSIAPRLNTRGAKRAAWFERCVVRFHDSSTTEPERLQYWQPLGSKPDDKPLYRGRTVMLVDERTLSQAEHTALFFEAASGTTLVGSRTAGADGGITALTLPGGLSMVFTGIEVRHADGRQLQRVGLPIDVVVQPTIRGIQTGRDEVLERALRLLRDERWRGAAGAPVRHTAKRLGEP